MISWQKNRFLTHSPYLSTGKPCIRWWWFYGPVSKEGIMTQLDWAKAQGFGGVELAWVYPGKSELPGPAWLGAEWCNLVAFTKSECEKRSLICDFTFGTLWPFGGSIVPEKDASRTFCGISGQRIEHSWEEATEQAPGYVLNHLDREALTRYASRMGGALEHALKGSLSALFCDSWEVEPGGLWVEGFGGRFQDEYGYSLLPYMEELDAHPQRRYDYRRLIGDYVLDEFYRRYTDLCHELGGAARVQCHGAPTDILAAYAETDIPESEALLFDPQFTAVASSAAALTGKPVVTCESFTCLYGWAPYPQKGPHHGQEQIADMKYIADALFANGVNHHIWHGMPYSDGNTKNHFYASVDVSPSAPFADDIRPFNAYLEKVSGFLKRGNTVSKIAVYMPVEDSWMSGELPQEKRRPSARYHWEFQYLRFPQELAGMRPLWISEAFLESAHVINGRIVYRKIAFDAVYVDVRWMELKSLRHLCRLAKEGATIILKRLPQEPGTRRHAAYPEALAFLEQLSGRKNGGAPFVHTAAPLQALVGGKEIPEFWCRRDGDFYYFFFAHPKASTISYPMKYGESYTEGEITRDIIIHLGQDSLPVQLRFEPYQSLLYEISPHHECRSIDISYDPPPPVTG